MDDYTLYMLPGGLHSFVATEQVSSISQVLVPHAHLAVFIAPSVQAKT